MYKRGKIRSSPIRRSVLVECKQTNTTHCDTQSQAPSQGRICVRGFLERIVMLLIFSLLKSPDITGKVIGQQGLSPCSGSWHTGSVSPAGHFRLQTICFSTIPRLYGGGQTTAIRFEVCTVYAFDRGSSGLHGERVNIVWGLPAALGHCSLL
jgi:hypothetical protein